MMLFGQSSQDQLCCEALRTCSPRSTRTMLAQPVHLATAFRLHFPAVQPALLKRLGQAEEVTRLLGPYLIALLPAVWVDAFYRCASVGSWSKVSHAMAACTLLDCAINRLAAT